MELLKKTVRGSLPLAFEEERGEGRYRLTVTPEVDQAVELEVQGSRVLSIDGVRIS